MFYYARVAEFLDLMKKPVDVLCDQITIVSQYLLLCLLYNNTFRITSFFAIATLKYGGYDLLPKNC